MSAESPSKQLIRAAWVMGFVAFYVLLDWISYVRPMQQLNLTPWNPAPALGLLFIIRRGRIAIAYVFAAIVVSDLVVRGMPGGSLLSLAAGAQLAAGYGIIALWLKRYMPDGGMFAGRRSLVLWSLIILGGTFTNSLVYVSILRADSLLAAEEVSQALIRFWVGDAVGIFVALPLFWWLQDPSRRTIIRSSVLRDESAGYLVLALVMLWIAFVPGASSNFRYFFVLFLPVVWAASRQGFAGAVFCVSFVQVGMIFVGLSYEPEEITLLELQVRALVLAIVGFLIGVAVDEHRRASAELRQSVRLAVAGEMAGALAHELNQPLTAMTAYCSACIHLLDRGSSQEQLREVVGRIADQAGRAADIVRRLRDFFRTGSTNLEPLWLNMVLEDAVTPFRERAVDGGIELSVGPVPAVIVLADRLQIELVVRNLLANAFEAAAESPRKPAVTITVRLEPGSRVVIEIDDSGPGFAPEMAGQLFEPFKSTKSSGLGLGLAISRAIAEAHGGSLTAEAGGRGRFQFTLPVETRGIDIHG